MDNSLSGAYKWNRKTFPEPSQFFNNQDFKSLPQHFRIQVINQTLLRLIQEEPQESFLLPAVLQFIGEINKQNIINEKFNLNHFEFWLNHFSKISDLENSLVRGKINGKWIPREEYQSFFPLGMNKIYEGSHFVTAHLSPDLDTTVASLFGWLDAFAARVGSRLHIWALPGGPPDSPTTRLVQEIFGEGIFDCARQTSSISLRAIDLVSEHNLVQVAGNTSTNAIDHGWGEKAVLFVDNSGSYQGNWRSSDVEVVRQVTVLYKASLHFYEHAFILGKIEGKFDEFRFVDSDDYTENQKNALDLFLKNILNLPKGIDSLFSDLPEIREFEQEVKNASLQESVQKLGKVVKRLRLFVERLDVGMKVKREVLGHQPLFVNAESDIDDIRLKIKHFDYIPVVISNEKLFPIGVIWASHLNKTSLGTVSFRDFCNLDEIHMPSYLSVISVIDHHKTSLQTTTTPLAIVGDAQSSNVLIAEKVFSINDRYSKGRQTSEEVEQEISLSFKENKTDLLQRLLQRRKAHGEQEGFFIHPDREYAEYLCFLHAILDDTDLLSKVTNRDVDCVAALLNRLQSLIEGKEVETIQLNDIPKDKNFAAVAAKRILKNKDMYAFYAKTYAYKERDVEKQLILGEIFNDTKEQNGCCRVGQTKLFSTNYPLFNKNREPLYKQWIKQAEEAYRHNPSLDLHIHMISTIAGAKEVFEEKPINYDHLDEMWFWVPQNSQALAHLATFLSGFRIEKALLVETNGPLSHEIKQIFNQNFADLSYREGKKSEAITLLFFDAGMVNSRKSMVTPYLPRLFG